MLLMCNALKCGVETLMSSLRSLVEVLRVECSRGAWVVAAVAISIVLVSGA
jgi:hypothetical protein